MSNPTFGHSHVLPVLHQTYLSDFEKLYDAYAPALLGVIQKISVDEQQASEFLQLAFQEIWKQKAEYQPDKMRLFTWLYQVTQASILAYKADMDGQAANVRSYVVRNPVAAEQSVNNFIRRLH